MLLEDSGVRPGPWDSDCSHGWWKIIFKTYTHQENRCRI